MNYKELIKQAVDKFLCWKLPEDFGPDGGISFDRSGHKYEPVGTNLFTATQAEQMFLDCLPEVIDDEIAWLVERNICGFAEWYGVDNWTNNPSNVVRFCRKQDAEAFIKNLDLKDCIASEHMWMGDR